jgi:hypothetical protein
MSFIGRNLGRRAIAAICACMLVGALASTASAQDEPAFVAPCGDGFEWSAEAGQPILFFCGWGTQGGPGLVVAFLNAYSASLTVEDEAGNPVLTIDAAALAALWSDPESFPSGFDDVTCAGPTGQGASWSYVLENGLPAGTYTVFLSQAFSHPVTDGFHTCWAEDGTRLVSPPDHLASGSFEAISTLIVEN